MNKIELEGLDQTLYHEELDNGLNVYFVPFPNRCNYSMHYVTKFGSVNTSFTPVNSDKEITVPDGIAHFLEHKMFESEDGIDPFTFASVSGTNCNASTSYHHTRYLFEGNKNFEENLDYLLTYVHSPYFTDENVEKEKGIIIEELLQYQDMVDCVLDNKVREGIFNVDPIRVDIGGTVESVKKITKEDLDITYQTFYQPSNMFLVITGNFDTKKAMDVIRSNKALNNATTLLPFALKNYSEPSKINQKSQELFFNTNTTKLAYSIKIPLKDIQNKKDFYNTNLYLSLMLSMLFGPSSDFREIMKKENKYTSFYYTKDISNDIIFITFYAETEKPKELMADIKNNLTNMALSERDFERTIKVWLSAEVMMSDNIDATLDSIVYDIVEFGNLLPNKIPTYKSLNFKDLKDTIQSLDFSNVSSVIIRPKNEK